METHPELGRLLVDASARKHPLFYVCLVPPLVLLVFLALAFSHVSIPREMVNWMGLIACPGTLLSLPLLIALRDPSRRGCRVYEGGIVWSERGIAGLVLPWPLIARIRATNRGRHVVDTRTGGGYELDPTYMRRVSEAAAEIGARLRRSG